MVDPAGRLAVYALTPKGAELARRLAERLRGDLYLPGKLAGAGRSFASLPELVAGTFHAYAAHVFVAACGIVVRCIAPHLAGKAADPAVVVLDQDGRHAVSLLSGHLGGANALARRVAAETGGRAVITTGTDSAGLPSLDLMARDSSLVIENLEAVRTANAALLAGESVSVFDPENRLTVAAEHCALFTWVAAPHLFEPGRAGVAVTWRTGGLPRGTLILRPSVVVAGVGCRRGAGAEAIRSAVLAGCEAAGAAPKSLACLASIEAKRDEPGLRQAARELGVDVIFYPAGRLAGVAVPTPSAVVAGHMGVGSVCEASALLAAGSDRLLLKKTKTETVTVALALAN